MNTIKTRLLILFHFMLECAIFIVLWVIYYRIPFVEGEYFVHNRTICASYIILLFVLSRTYSAYRVGLDRIEDLIYSQALANLITHCFIYTIACVMAQKMLSPLALIGCFLLQFIITVAWTVAVNKLYFKNYRAQRTLVIYKNKNDLSKLDEVLAIKTRWDVTNKIKIVKDEAEYYNQHADSNENICSANIHKLIDIMSDYDVIFVSGVGASLRNGIEKYCVEVDKECFFIPHTGDVITAGATHMQSFSVPIYRAARQKLNPEFELIKRLSDILVSAVALIIMSPFMIITAVAIKCDDGGPVFYRQVRLTKNGKCFKIIKFRSMKVDAEKNGEARLASENDDRITKVGSFIRKIRLDEVPQFFNILKGDMSLVGPRPERPEIAERYDKEIPAFKLRLQVKAGLTGYAQVYGRYNTEPKDKLKMDLIYINNIGIVEDIKLIFATIKILFIKKSTQGISEEQITAMRSK